MIVKTFDLYDFEDEFVKYDRSDNFSGEGLEALFDYYDNLPQPFELDVVGICEDWTEYENLEEYAKHYMNENELKEMSDDEKEETILRNLDRKTNYIQSKSGSVLVQDY